MADIDYRIHRSARRKRVGFRVDDSGVLEVHIPAGMSETLLKKLLESNRHVIELAFREYARRKPPLCRRYTAGELFPCGGRELPLVLTERLFLISDETICVPRGTPEEVRENLEKLYRRYARPFLEERCRLLGTPEGLIPSSVGITGAVTRWGSCSSRQHISFCWKIMLLPEELMEYIVCHELAHLRHLNHSKEFWALTEKLCPDAPAKRKKLNELPELWPPAR